MDEQKKGKHRRGQVLEEAILQAAWEELSKTGYTQMTIESVATRAGTNKSVLYRRWPDKSEPVMAVRCKYYFLKITNEIPITGNLLDDVYAYLRARVAPLKTIGSETIRALIMKPAVRRRIIASMPKINERKSESKQIAAMAAILKNAELRGEIILEKLMPRIISLPLDQLQYELITRLEPVSDGALAESFANAWSGSASSNVES
ncbi:TetR/AcrR family transcriptional regulator [Sporolactobacillus sp. CQH2019]|uniref:TetR/AcrR family transcriptional regulator n=1 Tax=Sporolactobacillus sp. CQH2019 TaxID=3023512 RepID=UPI002368D284|nr:TetR/AcrR family transcriptional regulator [Sporolactobacillus sp. CQH2019]MDD9147798.1 TetR/AcrR family transcriptional regulator [Sporolactobacillus sp. CQH2019]